MHDLLKGSRKVCYLSRFCSERSLSSLTRSDSAKAASASASFCCWAEGLEGGGGNGSGTDSRPVAHAAPSTPSEKTSRTPESLVIVQADVRHRLIDKDFAGNRPGLEGMIRQSPENAPQPRTEYHASSEDEEIKLLIQIRLLHMRHSNLDWFPKLGQ